MLILGSTWFESNPHYNQYLQKTSSHMTLYMQTTMAHGLLSKQSPFEKGTEYDPGAVTCVLTRATIRWRDMIRFWKYVPPVSGALADQAGPILALGIGEMPFRY
jgi:spheroidene monooxygenase